ncbi:MAG: hypothetical protein HYX21_03885 [Candidatus Yanofskybacteria bacterium]|nr:hypothetical protein [Candidatus Yanofskybacteria bacterium]
MGVLIVGITGAVLGLLAGVKFLLWWMGSGYMPGYYFWGGEVLFCLTLLIPLAVSIMLGFELGIFAGKMFTLGLYSYLDKLDKVKNTKTD